MPKLDGLEVVRRLARDSLGTKVVVLSGDLGAEELLEAVQLGVTGAVPKEAALDQLVGCLRAVQAGGQWLQGQLLGEALRRLTAGPPDKLTAREVEIVRLVVQGLRNKEIAARIGLIEGTVKVHLHRIYRKTGVTTRTGLAAYARKHGITP
jgi:DNA-binding NarL/FixJ family response regulator